MITAEVLEDFEPNFGLATYSCPLDIYTALPGMLLMRSKRDEEDRCIWCMMLPLFVGFIFSVVAQIASLVYIYVLIVEMKLERLEAGVPACSGGDYFLRIICNCACFATIAQSLKESMNLRTYIALMPKLNPEHIPILKNINASFVFRTVKHEVHDPDESKFEHDMECSKCKTTPIVGNLYRKCGGKFDILCENDFNALSDSEKLYFHKREIRKGESLFFHKLIYGGITTGMRCYMYLLFVLKISIEIALLYVGSAYILYADSNENIILNALSLTFVAELDNLAYEYLTSSVVKRELGLLPKFGYNIQQVTDKGEFDCGNFIVLMEQVFGSWILLAFFAGIPSLIYVNWCTWQI